jgi:hypothetical protein
MPSDRMAQIEDRFSSGVGYRLLNAVKASPVLARMAWRMLRLYQTLSDAAPDEHAQLKVMERAPPPPAGGRRVLFFSLRGWPIHLAWETTLARALHLRGAQTLTVVCDRVLPACEPRTSVDDFDSTCERCAWKSAHILPATGLPHRRLSEFVSREEVEDFRRRTAALSLDELQAFTAGGLPIGALVGASVNRHLLQGRIEPVPEHVAAYRRFVAAGLTVQAAVARLLDAYRPAVALAMNGVFYAEAIFLAMAQARAIPVWTYERAKKVDGLIFAKDVPVIKQDFAELWRQWRTRALTPEQDAALDDYLRGRASGDVGIERLWQDMRDSEAASASASAGAGAGASAVDGAATAVLFTNVLWDTAVYQSDIGFESMAEWVVHTVRWFAAHPQRRLIIRVHPAEVRVPFKASRDSLATRLAAAFPSLPSNVRVVAPTDPFSSYTLLAAAAVVLAYTSTIGLEAAVGGVPTIVAGDTHYRKKGFTLDPDTAAAYAAAIDQAFAQGRMAAADTALARRYAYLYFFDQIVPFRLVHEGPRSYVTFHYRRNEELRPGGDAALDAICAALLSGAPLVNPFTA